jgi:hypothetical protein
VQWKESLEESITQLEYLGIAVGRRDEVAGRKYVDRAFDLRMAYNVACRAEGVGPLTLVDFARRAWALDTRASV